MPLVAGTHDVTVGVDVWQRRLESARERVLRDGQVIREVPLPTSTMSSEGVFVEGDWAALQRLTLNAGGRVDLIQVENDATDIWTARDEREASHSVHVGGTFSLTENLCAKAFVAQGYRAATLEERYQYLVLGNGQTKLGDPDLDPETSRFYEAGLSWVGESLLASASVFQNDLHDLIGEKRRDAATLVNANVSRARIRGAELEACWRMAHKLECYGNAAWIVGKDRSTDEYLPAVAPLSGFAGVGFNRGGRGIWGYIETACAARQDKVPADVRTTAGWGTVDVRLGWNLKRAQLDHTLYVGAENLFDKAYRNYLTTYRGDEFNEPGRCLVVGYEGRF